jgi:hypothetical protein
VGDSCPWPRSPSREWTPDCSRGACREAQGPENCSRKRTRRLSSLFAATLWGLGHHRRDTIVELLPGHSFCKRDSSTSPNIPIPVVKERRPVRGAGKQEVALTDAESRRRHSVQLFLYKDATPIPLDYTPRPHFFSRSSSKCPPSRSSPSYPQTDSTAVLASLIPQKDLLNLLNKTSNVRSASLKGKTQIMSPMLRSAPYAPQSLVASKSQKPSTWTIWEVVCTQSPSSPVTSSSCKLECLGILIRTLQRALSFAEDNINLILTPPCRYPRSTLSESHIKAARAAVLDFFDAPSHEYVCVFTNNATGALKLVGEAYPFSDRSSYILPADCHNSVNGIRRFARAVGAEVRYLEALRHGGFDEAKMKVRSSCPEFLPLY